MILGLEEIEGFLFFIVWVGFKYIFNFWVVLGFIRGLFILFENVFGLVGWLIWFVYVFVINVFSGVCGMFLVVYIVLDVFVLINMVIEYCWMVKLSCWFVWFIWSV